MPWLRGTSSGVGAQGPGVCLYFLHFYLFICNPYEEAGTEVSHGPGDLVARWTCGGQFMGRFSLCSDRFCFTEHSVTHHSTFLPTKAPFHSHFPISEYTLLCGFGCTGFTLLLGKYHLLSSSCLAMILLVVAGSPNCTWAQGRESRHWIWCSGDGTAHCSSPGCRCWGPGAGLFS